jgi:phosphoglycolate phosphatase
MSPSHETKTLLPIFTSTIDIVTLSPTMTPILALFDIDGTLLRGAGPTHRDALIVGVREVLGVETRNDNIAVHGKLDTEILLEMMANAGVPRRRARATLPAIYRAAERYYLRNVPILCRKTCPGVRRLLYRLKRSGAVLGVVSGNLERIGWKKLERADLARYFRYGLFCERAATRTGLARLAVLQARRHRWINGHSPRVLIGDTPNDVAAGRANGLDTIAVATGLCSLEELASSGATLCAPDLTHPSVGAWVSEALRSETLRSQALRPEGRRPEAPHHA